MAVAHSPGGGPVLPSMSLLDTYAPRAPVAGVPEVVAHQAPDVHQLWLAWEAEAGHEADTPFWATAWPAARVCARCLLDGDLDVESRTVLDIGCGGGVVAVAAALAGASLTIANDTDSVALHVAALNARANGVALAFDARDLSSCRDLPHVDCACVADFFYERTVSAQMLRYLHRLAAAGTRVFVADGGRPFAPPVDGPVIAECRVDVDRDLEGSDARTVTVRELVARD